MTDPTITDLRRELAKARDALAAAERYLARRAESMAALHCATSVLYPPLHARVASAIAGADHALARTEGAAGSAEVLRIVAGWCVTANEYDWIVPGLLERGDRDEREWPEELESGGVWPWRRAYPRGYTPGVSPYSAARR